MGIVNGSDILASDFIYESEKDPTPANDAGRVPKLESDGKISNAFIRQNFDFGDGSDGDVTISSPTTLTRDMFYNNLTVNSTLSTDGFRIFVKGILSGNGTIEGIKGNNASGRGGGSSSGTGYFKTTAGSTAISPPDSMTTVAGTQGTIGNNSRGGIGAQYYGNSEGTVGTVINSYNGLIGSLSFSTILGAYLKPDATLDFFKSAGAGASCSNSDDSGTSSSDGSGGGGGASGGVVLICAKNWSGTFTIKSIGGNGGNGGNDGSSSCSGGNGGHGGNGGSTIVIYETKTWTGSYNLAGGTGGTGGTGNIEPNGLS